MTLSRFRFRSSVDPMEYSFFAHRSSSADIGTMAGKARRAVHFNPPSTAEGGLKRTRPTVANVARFNPL
jgi:hypothetical protein